MILQPRSQRFVTDKVLWKLAGHTHTKGDKTYKNQGTIKE